jgi:hypothetical protein
MKACYFDGEVSSAAPPAWTTAQLLDIRSALNIVVPGAPFGPRPDPPDNATNMASTNGIWHYPPAWQDTILEAYRARHYTHGSVGPFVDVEGYHNRWPPTDVRDPVQAAQIQAAIEKIERAGIIPAMFIQVDGWTIEQMNELVPIFVEPWWQAHARLVVNGFEQQGSKYGWSNATYVTWLTWLRNVFPNAIRLLHTSADIESPVGDGDDTSQPGMSDGECWGRVTPLIHGWLEQSNALFPKGCNGAEGPDFVADNQLTNEQNWFNLWDQAWPYSLVSRFRDGYAGWPTTSANGGPLKVYAGEFYSFAQFWCSGREDYARDHGARAVALGAAGSFDGYR